LVNDLSLADPPPPGDLIQSFRSARAHLEREQGTAARTFGWTLHERDGRTARFREYHPNAWNQWLAWYQFRHFRWNAPDDPRIGVFAQRIRSLGQRTWRRLFRRYRIPELDAHDRYSLPDVYYPIATLGRIPTVTLDVGGGWGRLGMAWAAVGVRTAVVTDAIEQPYVLQHQYLSAIPDVAFHELLGAPPPAGTIDPRQMAGVVHVPTWDLSRIAVQSVDVVTAVQVLREVDASFLTFLFDELQRMLVPGGIFYVRDNDHEYRIMCMHDIPVTQELEQRGFEVIAFPLEQGKDIHGVPRMFRWRGHAADMRV
jgi:hypothetical protein